MSEQNRAIIGRIGIIILLTGIVITVVGYLRAGALSHRLDPATVAAIGVGLIVVGAVLTAVFLALFFSAKR